MSLTRKTHPRIWQTTYLLNRAIARALAAEVARQFGQERTARVLDIGCGRMPYRPLFEGRCAEYVGCDLHPQEAGVTQCPAEALAFADESFDAVVSFQLLEHVRQPWRVLAECARVLKRRGLLLLTAPFIFPHHASPHDFFRYTHEGLAALAEEAGLTVEKVSAQCSSLTTLLLLTNWYVATIGQVLRRTVLTRPLAWLLTGLVVVPINLAGVLLDAPCFHRAFTKGNEGYSNYLILARKAA